MSHVGGINRLKNMVTRSAANANAGAGAGANAGAAVDNRSQAVTRAIRLNRITIGYNVVEAVVALAAGISAASISLIGFGLDSVIEATGALIITWRLAQEKRTGCKQPADRRATKLIAISFFALAAYVAWHAVTDLVTGERPSASWIGIVIAAGSLIVMPWLARQKRKVAIELGSRAQRAEASQTMLCAWLSAVLLVGLGANALMGWWWADPVAAIGIAVLAAVEGWRAWRADDLIDTCCA
ncbi:MAG: hypothetical protein FJW50_04135 [Actinobacteria bacterium]|nr:hypothetical protein [Actinomycetota bacterium]